MKYKNTMPLNTLQDLVYGLKQRGPKPALIGMRKSGHQIYTYEQLFHNAQRLAWGLIQKGVKPGEKVGLLGSLDAT